MQDLPSFIAGQERLGRVVRISEPLDPVGEAGARLAREEGRIVVLERVRGYDTPVVAGVASSRLLVAAAVGVEPERVTEALLQARRNPRPLVAVEDAPFLQTKLDSESVSRVVPLLTFRPGAARPYATAAIVAARSSRYGNNLSFHRLMYLGDNRFSVRVVPRHLAMILDEGQGEAEVAVLIGVHPAVCLAAATSAGPDFDELQMAAALLGRLDVVTLDTITVPAGCELVLRGRITKELAEEGPFLDLTGTLDGVRQQPVLRVSAIYARAGFFYHTIVPGGLEHRLLMGVPQEPRMFEAVANSVSSLAAVALTAGGCNWLHAVVALRRPRPGQARNAGLAALGAHPSLKRVVVVDEDIDVHDPEQVEWAMATRVQPDRDVIIVPACRGSSLDPSRATEDSTTAKWIIDATIPAGRDRSDFVRAKD
jgi:2,5-furandicarboxylate decarboxylase 1